MPEPTAYTRQELILHFKSDQFKEDFRNTTFPISQQVDGDARFNAILKVLKVYDLAKNLAADTNQYAYDTFKDFIKHVRVAFNLHYHKDKIGNKLQGLSEKK